MNNPLWVIKKIVTKYSNRCPYIKLLNDKLINYSKWNKPLSSSDSLLVLSAIHLLDPDSAKLKPRPSLNRPPLKSAPAPLPDSVLAQPSQFSAKAATKTTSTAHLPPADQLSRPSPTLLKLRPKSPRPAHALNKANHLPPLQALADTTKSPEPLKSEKKSPTLQLDHPTLTATEPDTSKPLVLSTTSTELTQEPAAPHAPKYASTVTPLPSPDSENQRPLP